MGIGNHTETITVGGRLMQRNVDKNADNENLYGGAASPIILAAGKTVTSWVKGDADTATCNLPAGHGYGDGVSTVDVYDADGTLYRYGVEATITTNAVALEGGSAPSGGSGFPDSATVGVIVCKQQQVNITLDGDLAAIVGVSASVVANVDFQDADGDSICVITLEADEPDMWDADQAVNKYAGDPITKAMVSNGTTSAGTFECIILQDSTPGS